MFPACAGMNLHLRPQRLVLGRVPRVRGDEPGANQSLSANG
uniref:Uncharacterized protein n=1 Tax=uncultured organism TaxID=155900 RepID=M1PF18_9ZZZZ|nr:putative uncharacterized protein [uncultured organism]